MKIVPILASWLIATAGVQAGWSPSPDKYSIVYSAKPDIGIPSLDDALKQLADAGTIGKFRGFVAHDLMFFDDTFRDELLAELNKEAPRELKGALKSAGNLHNPKMLALYPFIHTAVLATPTVRKIDASLAPYGLGVSYASFEEVRLDKKASAPRFKSFLWLETAKLTGSSGQ